MPHPEYLRRNLQVASAVGATAAARTALERLGKMKRPTKWISDAFKSVQDRTETLAADLAEWRDSAPDKPNFL